MYLYTECRKVKINVNVHHSEINPAEFYYRIFHMICWDCSLLCMELSDIECFQQEKELTTCLQYIAHVHV